MTIVIDSSGTSAYLVEKNLYKLVNVITVDDASEKRFFSRDLALVKVKASTEVGKIADKYGARIIDHSDDLMIVEMSDEEQRIEKLIDELRPLGIVELVRTGVVAMGQGDQILQRNGAPV
jgi:acetolactate synthase I/III small subunit